jgi:hypothetical protein
VSFMASGSVEGEEGGGEEEDGKPELCRDAWSTDESKIFLFYAHSTSDSDRESVLGLKKLYFELKRKVCTKQTSMKDFFCKT